MPQLKDPAAWLPRDDPYWVRVIRRVATMTGGPDPTMQPMALAGALQSISTQFPRLGQYIQQQGPDRH